MSSPHNPDFDPQAADDLRPVLAPVSDPLYPAHLSTQPILTPPTENPRWSGWAVLGLAAATLIAVVLSLILVSLAAHHYFYRGIPWPVVVTYPALTLLAQSVAYLLILALMYTVATHDSQETFCLAIRWNWPRNWAVFLMVGMLLAFGVPLLERFLPVPKRMPIEDFLRTPRDAWLLSMFGVTFAPLFEELFFRGFLYPVLVRRLGMVFAIVLTSVAFASIHAGQLLFSWGPVLGIFLVGMALTIVRALKKSVAASLLVHVAYNTTLFLFMYKGTDGFRHLDKLANP